MSIYQVKLKGKEGSVDFYTFLARDVEDTVKQATETREVTILGKKHTYEGIKLEDIEGVNLLLCEDDIDRVVHELKIRLDGAFTDLEGLIEVANEYDPEDLDFAALNLAIELIKEKTEQVYSTMRALHTITSDTPSRFGYKRKSES